MTSATLGAFPKPPEQRTIQLPTGASLTGAVDLPKGLDEQCKVSFNLMLQLGPFLASIECLLHILQFLQDLLKFTQDVPDAIKNPLKVVDVFKDVEKLAKDGEKLAHCFSWAIPGLPLICFIKDVLQMIHDFVACILELLDSVLQQQLQLQIQFADADQEGNQELLDVLHLAEDNMTATMGQAMQSMGPILSLLQLVGGLLEVVGQGALAAPSLDQLTGGSIEESLQVLKDLNQALEVVIEALPC
jgi:hypothetical protein